MARCRATREAWLAEVEGGLTVNSVPRIRGDRVLRRARKVLSVYEADSLRALLHAACSSPTARQASATCTALLLSCWQTPPSGSRSATARDLPLLVKKLRSVAPELGTVEDFLPLDPRLAVRFRARQSERHWNFRVHPGPLESPLDLLQQLANYAEALDLSIQAQLGFWASPRLFARSRAAPRHWCTGWVTQG
jgi:hypothetical protein